jgi:hypothetical protein
LLRAAPDRHSERSDEEIDAQFAVFKWVGARITPPVRLLHLNGSSAPFDTTRTAVMVTRETGIDSLAKTAARARAQYAVAAWTVLQPPAQYQLIPDVGTWTPQPFLQLSQQHRPTSETPSFAEAGPTGSMRGHSPYVLPDERVLRIPFTAMENLDRRSAQAALSASLQHLSAARASRLLPSERIRALLAGMESLGEPSQGHANGIQRFKKLVSAHGLWGTAASRGWDEQRLRDAIGRMRRARNIATHGADASLLDLGYPVGVQRPMRHELAMGHELATGALLSDLEVLIHLLGRTLAAVFEVQSANSWDDSVFERACR